MIHEVSGDILLSKARAIAHGVAPNDDFKSGLALSLRTHCPSMYEDFRHYFHTTHPKTGDLWAWVGPDGQRIISLYTQDSAAAHGSHPGKAHPQFVNHALRNLRKLVETEKITSLALPRLATGVGGLEWKEVSPLIAHYLGDLPIPIFVYTRYQADVRAQEPGLV